MRTSMSRIAVTRAAAYRATVVVMAALCLVFAGLEAAHAASVLPTPPEPFKGKIALKDMDSVPAWPQPVRPPKGAPNIVLILLDDVGFSAAKTFGGIAETPALDRLAARGLRYNNFHTTALCSPTRAALLTGRNHHRVGFGAVTDIARGFPGYNSVWQKDTASVADVLRRSGYSTAAFGKWHNTPNWEVSPIGPFDRWPTGLGFEYFYGFMAGEASQYEPPLYRNTVPVEPGAHPSQGYHVTTDIVDDAITWVQTHNALADDKPYFLYLAPAATHTPHHVPQEWVEKYRGKFDMGWDKMREQVFARLQKSRFIPDNAKLTARPKELAAWNSLTADQKNLAARQMEVFAAFMAHTDSEILRLLNAVEEGPGGDNTLIFYVASDNGGDASAGPYGSDNALASFLSGIPISVEAQLPNINELGGPMHDNNFANAWAWATNAPFKGAKGDAAHFGGIRTPLVVSWPSRIKDEGGLRTQFTHVNSIAGTIYEAVGVSMPDSVDGVMQEPLDGVSFANTFDNPAAPAGHRVQYFEMIGNRGIYKDGWFASAFHWVPWFPLPGEDFENKKWALYDLTNDYSQARDLADKYPEKLKEMQDLFDAEARKNDVYPLGNAFSVNQAVGEKLPTVINPQKRSFIYYPGFPRVPVAAAPDLQRSYRVTANVTLKDSADGGIIFTDGGHGGGYTLYLKDGHLIYENNFFNISHDVIRSTKPLPLGRAEVRFEFERTDKKRNGGGVGRLYVNGDLVGEGNLARVGIPARFDSFSIGRAAGSPVSTAYEMPFAFTGTLHQVRIDLAE